MEIIDKKLQRTRKIINFLISVVLASFLILLSNSIIGDLSQTVDMPSYNDISKQMQDADLEKDDKLLTYQMDALFESNSNITKMVNAITKEKEAEQKSFDNWVTSRSTLGKTDQDPEVIKRLRKLDEYQSAIQIWNAKSDSVEALITPLRERKQVIHKKQEEIAQKVREVYNRTMDNYDLRVFLIRLCFIGPILALGVFFFIRYRRHKFSPLFLGFTLFSLYAFFVGLVPFLPSYGGYVRSIVGILLTIGLGYYAIKRLRIYSERKKAELKSSSEERANNLQTNIAEKAFNNHVCPSCGKDFILKNWEGLDNVDLQIVKPTASHYCRYCGMQLIKECSKCNQKNYAHLPYCIKCGESLK